jgi:hypothetical protein
MQSAITAVVSWITQIQNRTEPIGRPNSVVALLTALA